MAGARRRTQVSGALVSFRCTAFEKAELERMSLDRGLSQSDLLRAWIAQAGDGGELEQLDVDEDAGERALLCSAA